MIIIDRFEGDAAVCEDAEREFTVPRAHIAENAREGDVIIPGGVGYIVDEEATAARRASLKARFAALTRRPKEK